jgi:tetratricopeptide (TPR) repeat protein
MNRDNLLFTVCGFVIGLVVGALALGPVLYRSGVTSRSLFSKRSPAAATAAPPLNSAVATPAGDPAVMQNVMQQVAGLKEELQKNPSNFEAAVQLGNLYMDARKYPQAVSYYEKALAVHDDPNVATDLGICYRGSGDLQKALTTFEAIQQKHPDHWQSLFNKAIVLVDLKRNAEARGIVDQLKRQRPDDADVKQFDEALREIEKK